MKPANHSMELLKCRFFVLLAAVLLVMTTLPLTVHADEIEDQLAAGSYVKGEAIAAFRIDTGQMQAQSGSSYEVTELISVDSSVVEEASQENQTQGSAELPPYSIKETASLTDDIEICVVSSDTLSTEELLNRLADDPNVVFAEPNYTFELDSDFRTDEFTPAAKGNVKDMLKAQSDEGSTEDLTYMQWGNWSNDQTIRTEGMTANPSINVPGFGAVVDDEGNSGNMDRPVTVALLDTGVYYEHPDLKNVLYQFTPEQQKALGCWEWGYNAVGKGMYGDVIDEKSIAFGHGTHTAGIIGAEWNGSGTSGVASNVRIVCIELADGEGNESLADALAAYAFVNHFNELVPEEERITITSNSWSEYSSSRAIDAVLRDLGERWGIVSVFSSGNDGKNNDRYEKTPSSSADNPYVIVVANTAPNDKLNPSSEFGTATVDLAAPGTNILSTTVPGRGCYCPDESPDKNLVYLGFDGQDNIKFKVSQVYHDDKPQIYEEEEVVSETVATTSNLAHFSGQNCLKIDIDPEYVVDESSWVTESKSYDLQFDVDLEGTDIGSRFDGVEDLMLGLTFATEKDRSSLINYASSNATLITENVPVKTESGEETTVEVTRPTGAITMTASNSSDGQWGIANFNITYDMFVNEIYNPGIDHHVSAVNPGSTLSIKLRVSLPEGCTTLYIDSIGIGTHTVPYEFASGTSMACPAVSGAAAVLASQEGYKGTELASLVRSKVRIPESGALGTRTGGIFDFSIAGSPEGSSGQSSSLAPVINDVTVSSSLITITGSNFGSNPGSVELSRYIAGAGLQPVTAHIASWEDDKVTLESEAPFTGILHVVLTNAGGKHDTRMRFAEKSENVYEQDLPFSTSTGDTSVYGDGEGDWETRGPLVGLGGKLYHLPAYCGQTVEYPAYRSMRCFDIKTEKWTDLPDLPEWLQDISAVMYEGKIVVEGATMYVTEWGEPTGRFPEGKREERVYVYDPGSNQWTKASAEGMYLDQSILNDGGQLKLAGGILPNPDDPYEMFSEPAPFMDYDLATGAGKMLCDLLVAFKNPAVAVKDGTILMYSAGSDSMFIRIQDGQAVLLGEAAPDFFLAEGDEPRDGSFGNVMKNPYRCVLAPISDGFVLVGPPATGGASDTYILRDGSDKFEAYAKRSSDDRAYSQAGCTYCGRLFIIASSWFEPEMRLFRATAMDVPEYPGDTPDEEKPAEKIEIGTKVVLSKTAFTYNGKVQKPSIKTVDGKRLKSGTDYTVKWSNPSSKNVGSYTLTITGKGNYTGTAKAKYKINPKGTRLKKLKRAKKAVKAIWKKQPARMSKSRITGYQIQLATNRKFTKNKKTVTVKGYKKVTKKITKLKGKKKYYVKIRTYKIVGGVKYYSPWSEVKTVKTR